MQEYSPEEQPKPKHPFHDRYSDAFLIRLGTAVALRATVDQMPGMTPADLMADAVIEPARTAIQPDRISSYFSAN